MGRAAVVTGGGTGIGRGIALALARRGVDVAVVGRRAQPLAAVVAEAMELGVKAVAFPTDLASDVEQAALPDRLHAEFGPIDILVNNAAVFAGGEVSMVRPVDVHQALMLNLLAPMALVQHLIPDLVRGRGTVVFVASTLGLVPVPGSSVYAATKAGLSAFAEALRYELEPQGIGVLLCYPPGTATAMTKAMGHAAGLPRYPLADPEAVGERIVRALADGRTEVRWGTGDRAMVLLHRWAPVVARKLIAWQRHRLIRMLSAPHE